MKLGSLIIGIYPIILIGLSIAIGIVLSMIILMFPISLDTIDPIITKEPVERRRQRKVMTLLRDGKKNIMYFWSKRRNRRNTRMFLEASFDLIFFYGPFEIY